MLGEYHHESFPKDIVGKASCPLDTGRWYFRTYDHSTWCAKYLLTFIYYFSRFFWIYTIRFKGEASDTFKDFKSPVENHNNDMIKSINIDIGDAYFGDEFHPFLTSHDIIWNKGVTQRDEESHWSSRVILEMACCMLHSQQMELKF